MRRYSYYLLAIILLLGRAASAQEIPRIVSFNKNQYKAYNQNWGISQSPEGIMYFANSAGLLEYDGQYWQTYPLPGRQILRAVAADNKGHIFGGGYGEFGFWRADTEGNLQYQSLREQLDYKPAGMEEIWNIVVDSGLVLFQSFSDVYAYDYEKVYQIEDPGLLLFIRKIGDKWIFPVMQDGLYSWSPAAGFAPLKTDPELAGMRIKALVPRSSGGFWAATERNGIFLINEKNEFAYWPTDVDKDLKDFQINRVIQLQSGNLAVGTILNGIYILNTEGRLLYHANKESGLQNNTVLGLWEDQQGNLWSALDKGIDLLLLSQPLNFYPDISGLLGTVYSARLFEGRLYVGTNQGLYVRDYRHNERFQLIEGTQGQVWDLFVHDGLLWCGHNNGTFLVSGRQIRWISSVTGGWRLRAWPEQAEVLVQSTYTGFVIFKKIDGQWRFSNRVNGLQAPIKQFFFDGQGFIWALHSTQGLWRLRFNEQLDSLDYLRPFSEADGLPTTFGLDLVHLDQQLLVRSDTTFLQWAAEKEKLLPVREFNSQKLPDQRVSLVPGAGQEWFLATADRIRWFRGDRELADLPLQLVPSFEEIIPIDTANYLFCLDNGYALLDRKTVQTGTAKKTLPLIRRVEVVRPARRMIDPFRSSYANGKAMEFKPQERQIRFYFALPYFGEQLRFRYRLINYDDQWSEWSPLAVAEFSNLRSGQYILEVEADQGTGIARQTFDILPHWYETVWAKIGYLLLAFLAALLVWRWHKARLRRHLNSLAREKEKQLQEERIRARNEKLQEDVLRKSQELANSTFSLVRKNEILMQLKEELLNNTRLDRYQNTRQMVRLIDSHITDEADWKMFETNFNQVHEVFFKKLRAEYEELTPGDLRLAAYLRMNLSSKEIAPLLNISLRGVENKRYRLRRKMGLDADTNLADFLMQY